MPLKKSVIDAFEALGLGQDAPFETVRTTYKQMALKTHPDKNPGSEEANEQFQSLGHSYSILQRHFDDPSSSEAIPPPFGGGRHGGGGGGPTFTFTSGGATFTFGGDGGGFGFGGFPRGGGGNYYDDDDYDDDEEWDDEDDDEFSFDDEEDYEDDEDDGFPSFGFSSFPGGGGRGGGRRGFDPMSFYEDLFEDVVNGGTGSRFTHRRPPRPYHRETPQEAAKRKARDMEELKEKEMKKKEQRMKEKQEEMKEGSKRRENKMKEKKEKRERDEREVEMRKEQRRREEEEKLRKVFEAAAKYGDGASVRKSVWEDGVDASLEGECRRDGRAGNEKGRESFLHAMVRWGDLETVEWLCGHSADLDLRDSFSFTPFHISLLYGRYSIFSFFLSELDSPLTSSKAQNPPKGWTFFGMAVKGGEEQIVQTVLREIGVGVGNDNKGEDNETITKEDVEEWWEWVVLEGWRTGVPPSSSGDGNNRLGKNELKMKWEGVRMVLEKEVKGVDWKRKWMQLEAAKQGEQTGRRGEERPEGEAQGESRTNTDHKKQQNRRRQNKKRQRQEGEQNSFNRSQDSVPGPSSPSLSKSPLPSKPSHSSQPSSSLDNKNAPENTPTSSEAGRGRGRGQQQDRKGRRGRGGNVGSFQQTDPNGVKKFHEPSLRSQSPQSPPPTAAFDRIKQSHSRSQPQPQPNGSDKHAIYTNGVSENQTRGGGDRGGRGWRGGGERGRGRNRGRGRGRGERNTPVEGA